MHVLHCCQSQSLQGVFHRYEEAVWSPSPESLFSLQQDMFARFLLSDERTEYVVRLSFTLALEAHERLPIPGIRKVVAEYAA